MDLIANIFSGVATLVLLKTLYEYASLSKEDGELERIVQQNKELQQENNALKEKLKNYEKD